MLFEDRDKRYLNFIEKFGHEHDFQASGQVHRDRVAMRLEEEWENLKGEK